MESNNNSQNNNKSTINFKIILVGDTGVGKTCLIKNAAKDIFDEIHTPTLGFDMLTFECTIDKNPIKLEIWDTCGQEAYKSLISSFYKDSALAMMVYSIDSNDSFCHIESWLKDIKQQSNPDVKIFLIGNKADLEEKREVDSDKAKQFIEENNIEYFKETSAKSGLNVKEVFLRAAQSLYEEHLKYRERANSYEKKNIPVPVKLNSKKNERKSGWCCLFN